MSRPREFKQVDVFASAPFLGNPLAAVVDGTDLPAELMQRFARWTNLSGTVFLLPRRRLRRPHLHALPGASLRRASHARRGAGLARQWRNAPCAGAHRPGMRRRARADRLRRRGPRLPSARDAPQRSDQEDRLAEIAAALGVDAGRILDHQWVDDGPGWAAVEVSSAEEVLALEPDFSGLPEAMVGVVGARGRRGPGEAAYEVRAFAPGPAWPRTR